MGGGLVYHHDAPEYQQAGSTNRGTWRRKGTAKCANDDDDELNAVHTASAKRTKPQIPVSTTHSRKPVPPSCWCQTYSASQPKIIIPRTIPPLVEALSAWLTGSGRIPSLPP